MKTFSRRHHALALIALTLSVVSLTSATGQVITYEPAEPKWGETITVTYDTSAEGSEFEPTDDVRLTAFVYAREKARQQPYDVIRDGDLLIANVPVEPGMSTLTFYFCSAHQADRSNAQQVSLFREDGVPAPGAHVMKMLAVGPDGWEDEFAKEIELYPDDIYTYRMKWFVAGAFDKARVNAIVEADLATLASRKSVAPDEWLYVQIFGRMTLKDEPAARAALLELLAEYGDTVYAYKGANDYDYHAFSQSIKGEGPEQAKAAAIAAMQQHPASTLAREYIQREIHNEAYPLESIESICGLWLDESPRNPMPHCMLAIAYLARPEVDDALELAIHHARLAIDGMLTGDMNFHQEFTGYITRRYLPRTYRIWAEAALALGRPGDAVAAARAAAEVEDKPSVPSLNLLGEIWGSLGDFDRAADAYARAYQAGDDEAKATLEALYAARHESAEGFGDFFADLTAQPAADDQQRDAAIMFEGTGLNGEFYELSQLKGKVIVLNFWFIGCAPCRVEMPGLNELVAEYEDRDDIEFLAFAMDPADKLREFLKEKAFDYEVIPNGGGVAQAWEVSGYPTHVIIDREGRIAFRRSGGAENTQDELRPLINRVLGE